MYRTMVKDANSFLELVLGRKQKFIKIMQNQLNGRMTFDTQYNMNIIKSSKTQSNYPRKLALSKQNSMLKKRKSKNLPMYVELNNLSQS